MTAPLDFFHNRHERRKDKERRVQKTTAYMEVCEDFLETETQSLSRAAGYEKSLLHLPFGTLLPDTIFTALKTQGYVPTGALSALNSYENRVYDVGLETGESLIVKFYRPGRWSFEALCDEHQFVEKLTEAELPVIAPMPLVHPCSGRHTLGQIDGRYYALYPKFKGRDRADLKPHDLTALGEFLARLHNQGEDTPAQSRQELTPDTYGYDNLDFILTQHFLPSDLAHAIESTLGQVLDRVDPFFDESLDALVVHGDFHLGNILWNAYGPHVVDFDDMVIAPPVQDVWMLFSGTSEEKKKQHEAFFLGYERFRTFNHATLILSEPLRTLRMIAHAAWIGKRYDDPAFKHAFPYYTERRYWESFLLGIKEQIALLQDL